MTQKGNITRTNYSFETSNILKSWRICIIRDVRVFKRFITCPKKTCGEIKNHTGLRARNFMFSEIS